MKIVWDETKRQANIQKHELDFAELTPEFFLEAYVVPAKQDRWLAIGNLNGRIAIATIYRPLGSEAISIILMRRASSRERRNVDD